MGADYGKKMTEAMTAVRGKHADCIRLFRDLDRSLSSYESLYGNVVTLNLGSSISRQSYIAEGLIRLYAPKSNEQQVIGVNICFYDQNDPSLLEPLFVAARTQYMTGASDPQEKLRKGWDPWYAFLDWSPQRVYNQVITIERPAKRPSIDKVFVAATPLYSVITLEAALAVVDLIGHPYPQPRGCGHSASLQTPRLCREAHVRGLRKTELASTPHSLALLMATALEPIMAFAPE